MRSCVVSILAVTLSQSENQVHLTCEELLIAFDRLSVGMRRQAVLIKDETNPLMDYKNGEKRGYTALLTLGLTLSDEQWI